MYLCKKTACILAAAAIAILPCISSADAASPKASATGVRQVQKQRGQQDKPAVKMPQRPLKQPPASRSYMRSPQPGDFTTIASKSGGYIFAMPAWGADPLAGLENLADIMIVRTAGNSLAAAATVLDSSDTLHYKPVQPLPSFDNKKVLWKWEHNSGLTWQCALSTAADYHGDKMLLEARASQGGKTYQLLYVFPADKFTYYLPMALYSINSFRLTAPVQK